MDSRQDLRPGEGEALDFRVGGLYRFGMLFMNPPEGWRVLTRVRCREPIYDTREATKTKPCRGLISLRSRQGPAHRALSAQCDTCGHLWGLAVHGWTIVGSNNIRNPIPSTKYDHTKIYTAGELRSIIRDISETSILLEGGRVMGQVAMLGYPR